MSTRRQGSFLRRACEVPVGGTIIGLLDSLFLIIRGAIYNSNSAALTYSETSFEVHTTS